MKLIDLLVEMSKGNYPDKFKLKNDNIIWYNVNDIYVNEEMGLFEEYCNIFISLNEEIEIIGNDINVGSKGVSDEHKTTI